MEVEKEFTVEPSQTSAEIAEAFGIGGGYTRTVLDIELPDTLPRVTYITGESGCGKTTLLHELCDGSPDHISTVPDGPLWTWGKSVDTSLEYMSKAGLSDATMFVSTYSELSDSQQYRARLYHALLSDSETLYFDEFLSTLDRETAHAVAYVFQKVCRRNNKQIVVATAHNDLVPYLQPDLTVRGTAFPHDWNVERTNSDIENPFIENISFEWKDKDWYNACRLGELHYKGKYTGGVKDYLAVYYGEKLVGLLISTYRMHDGGRRISRLVVHPSYRGIGIGQALVSKYLEKEPAADTVAQMAKYNPVFEKGGMERVDDVVHGPPSGLKTDLKGFDFDRNRWHDKDYCIEFMGERETREMFAEYANDVAMFVRPSGENISTEAVKEKLQTEQHTAGRVLWNVRPKRMAKFVGPEYE